MERVLKQYRESQYADYARGYAAGSKGRNCPHHESERFKRGWSAGRDLRFRRIVAEFKATQKASDAQKTTA